MSSGSTDRKADWPGSCTCGIARSFLFGGVLGRLASSLACKHQDGKPSSASTAGANSATLTDQSLHSAPAPSAQRPKAGTDLLRKELRLLPGGEVTALGELIEVNQFRIRPLCPAPRRRIEFVREDAHGYGDGDAFGVEIPFAEIFPVKTGARKRRVRQPGDCDVVEDVVAREALGLVRRKTREISS